MQDHELTAWLGDTTVTDEQRAALHAAADSTASRYPDDTEAAERAFAAASQVILGDATIESIAAEYHRARAAEREAMERLTGAIIASAQATNESAISDSANLNRMTVRKALGK